MPDPQPINPDEPQPTVEEQPAEGTKGMDYHNEPDKKPDGMDYH